METLIPLNELRFGHEAEPPINVRTLGRETEIDEYVSSIRAHGLIHSLSVKELPDGIFAADGNRRLSALRRLETLGEIPSDFQVKCEVLGAETDGAEISLAANVVRRGLHEADQHAAFVHLSDSGMTEADIASRFGIEPKRVARILALGKLSPKILDAWRDGTLGNNVTECVRAFTLAPSTNAQEQVFERLKKEGRLWSTAIRAAFGAGDQLVARNLALVGKDNYVAAGGKLTIDLFGTSHVVSDPVLLQRLADEQVSAECARLLEDGWAWAELETDLPHGVAWSWSREDLKPAIPKKAEKARLTELEALLEAGDATDANRRELQAMRRELQLRPYGDALRARVGVIVSVSSHGGGRIELRPGYSKPSKSRRDDAGDGAAREKKRPSISNAMMSRLSTQLTLAARAAIAKEPRIGLVALLAGFIANEPFSQPVRVKLEGYQAAAARAPDPESYANAFERLARLSDENLFRVAAGIAADSLNLSRHEAGTPPLSHQGIAQMLAAIDPETLDQSIKEQFDPEDYFGSVSKL